MFVLRHHIRGATWMVYNANSGGRKTRVYPRSIAGWTIVNPLGAKVASGPSLEDHYAEDGDLAT